MQKNIREQVDTLAHTYNNIVTSIGSGIRDKFAEEKMGTNKPIFPCNFFTLYQ